MDCEKHFKVLNKLLKSNKTDQDIDLPVLFHILIIITTELKWLCFSVDRIKAGISNRTVIILYHLVMWHKVSSEFLYVFYYTSLLSKKFHIYKIQ